MHASSRTFQIAENTNLVYSEHARGKREIMTHTEVLLSDSIAGAVLFARELGWKMLSHSREFQRPSGEVVVWVRDPEQLLGLRKAVAHVGYFNKSRESLAARRHLINIAESRGIHVIPYDFSPGKPPEPLRICLICGSLTPCLWPEDLTSKEMGVPCTFDLSYLEMLKLLKEAKAANDEHRRRTEQIETTHIPQLERQIEGLQQEVAKIKDILKAYRGERIAAGAHAVARSGTPPLQQVPERPRG
jgi:hypothetical protein